MAYDNTLTIIGNLTRDPELKFLGNGIAICKFSVASNQKKANGENESHYFDCVAWRDLGENVAESYRIGDRVLVHGKLKQDRWKSDDGSSRSKIEIEVEDCGLSNKWATTVGTKTKRAGDESPKNSGGFTSGKQSTPNRNEEPF